MVTTPGNHGNYPRNDELIEAFNMIDKDSGGEISLDELREAMNCADVGITQPEMKYLFRKVTNTFYYLIN